VSLLTWLCSAPAVGCLDDDGRGDTTDRCAAARVQALYFGSAEPEQLELSVAERAAIGTVASEPSIAICTGQVIERGWVLSAAHCNIDDAPTFRGSAADAETLRTRSVAVHPTLDLMLLELEDSASAQALTPVPLWSGAIDDSWIGREVTLAGVGETETGEFGALRFLVEPVVAVDENDVTVDGMGKSGACSGDSGGPLLVAAQDGSPRVAGVLDRGSRNCLGIDLYTRADRIVEWAAEVTGGIACTD